jgi:hypothetical protein
MTHGSFEGIKGRRVEANAAIGVWFLNIMEIKKNYVPCSRLITLTFYVLTLQMNLNKFFMETFRKEKKTPCIIVYWWIPIFSWLLLHVDYWKICLYYWESFTWKWSSKGHINCYMLLIFLPLRTLRVVCHWRVTWFE